MAQNPPENLSRHDTRAVRKTRRESACQWHRHERQPRNRLEIRLSNAVGLLTRNVSSLPCQRPRTPMFVSAATVYATPVPRRTKHRENLNRRIGDSPQPAFAF